jgi:hypothetical protein
MIIPLKFSLLVGAAACLVLAVWIALFHYQIGPYRPLEEPVRIHFSNSGMPVEERARFLAGDFTIINKMHGLPSSIIGNYAELHGNRLTMADPGREFQVGDVIYDASLPRKRLIFAAIQNQKCFLHFEQGGRGHSFVLAFFTLDAMNRAEPVWVGYCNRSATDLTDLRSMMLDGGCH